MGDFSIAIENKELLPIEVHTHAHLKYRLHSLASVYYAHRNMY